MALISILPLLLALNAGCKSARSCPNGAAATVSGEHGHTVEIPADHIQRKIGGSYPVRGDGHEHVVTLRDADIEVLAAGKPVRTLATSVNGHTHEVEVACR